MERISYTHPTHGTYSAPALLVELTMATYGTDLLTLQRRLAVVAEGIDWSDVATMLGALVILADWEAASRENAGQPEWQRLGYASQADWAQAPGRFPADPAGDEAREAARLLEEMRGAARSVEAAATTARHPARPIVRQSAVIHPDWSAKDHQEYVGAEHGLAVTVVQVRQWLASPSLVRAQQLAAAKAPLADINAALTQED